MRKGLVMGTLLLSTALTVTGCLQKTGDLGNKNIRPNAVSNDGIIGTNKMRFANDQRNAMNRINGERRANNNVVGMHGNAHMQMSDIIADKVAALPGIDSAYVMMTDRNAYVAVKEQGGGMHAHSATELSGATKTKIADKVKSMSPSTENVYVTQNPDFMSRMQGFAQDVRSGHPVQGFITEFNALVERIFPAESSRSNR
ncbi:YhcN/YlaJ family sporulation lipoprotein [Cohnella yongneupensis]|uniref:YhcN/YlaJ family sporulation lipoprotein n=1 Tax=Cohnella yongneupensis TaxID=425006 RepID=A0ABW0QZV9_9BACL